MNNSIFTYARPQNEPVLNYYPGSKERKALMLEIEKMRNETMEIPLIIGGKEIRTGDMGTVVMPHNHSHILAHYHKAGEKEVKMAIKAAMQAHKEWESFSWVERLSISIRIAELIAKKYRQEMNAATMLGQSKNVYQSEIDAVCETVDFIRFNAHYVSNIYNKQPLSETSNLNRIEYRPLEGFVFAVSPFNFTSISSNLSLAPVLLGNTVVWKPASTALLSNYLLMRIWKEAGLPDGVINFIPGQGSLIGNVVLKDPDLGAVHFTGSNHTFNHIWKEIGNNLNMYRSYPRIVGETGGKDFIFVHESADVEEVATAIVRGAYEYQGQKCSAASRAYIPVTLWDAIRAKIAEMMDQIHVGDVEVFSNFMNALIDEASYDNIMTYIEKARKSDLAEIVFGGEGDKSGGYFIQPTLILTTDPHFVTMEEEIFGPVMTVFLYDPEKTDETLELCDSTSPYALTGSVFSKNRAFLSHACRKLKYAAGNFYYNDKPTGAVVGQQPFGGSRASGTNDKAGSYLNLLRWINPRTIKETFLPSKDFKYPFMKEGSCSPDKG
jgi:1-pyrroline-5-carboxylate dehydrogenase